MKGEYGLKSRRLLTNTNLLALVLLAMLPSVGSAQRKPGAATAPEPFKVSSFDTPFGLQGEFIGEYRLYPGRIEIRVTQATIKISEHCPYQGRRLLSSLKFVLASASDGDQWQPVGRGEKILLEQIMSSGEIRELGELYFHIPINANIDLSKHWLLAEMEDVPMDVPDARRRKGFSFAHSCRDIFVRKPRSVARRELRG